MKSAALIFNPRAGAWGASDLVERIRRELEGGNYRVELLGTEQPGHAAELAREASGRGVEAVFAFGGDGTLREAASGLLGTETTVAPIPGGTTNVVATAFGIPQNPLAAAAALADTRTIEMDVGLCGGEVFLMQTSAGLDARIMARLAPGLKRRFGKLAVAWSGLLQLSTYDYPEIELVADGKAKRATLAAICNLPQYAGAWKMAPDASVTDGTLDLVLFRGRSRTAMLAFAKDFVLGKHVERTDVDTVQVERVELLGPRGLSVQLDGDALPVALPVEISICEQKLRFLAPA